MPFDTEQRSLMELIHQSLGHWQCFDTHVVVKTSDKDAKKETGAMRALQFRHLLPPLDGSTGVQSALSQATVTVTVAVDAR